MAGATEIDISTPLGQITFIAVAVVVVIQYVKPLIKTPKQAKASRTNRAISEELKISKRELEYSRQLRRDLTEWQLVSKELTRTMKLELIGAGVEPSPKMEKLSAMLDEIENRSIENILEEESGKDSEPPAL